MTLVLIRTMSVIAAANDIEKFITRWTASSGNERANFQSFANELCRIIGVKEPEPAKEVGSLNDYTFERKVEFSHLDSSRNTGRIDLYKKHSFIMEAKQSREKGRAKALNLPGQLDLIEPDYKPRGQRTANRAWDQLMISARRQAEDYARALPPSHGWPPFVLVCDVGHCIEVYADFSARAKTTRSSPTGRVIASTCKTSATKNPQASPADLGNPTELDPRDIPPRSRGKSRLRLAEVSKALEKRGEYKPRMSRCF